MKLLTLLLLVLFLCGCAGPKHVTATEFQRQYAWIGQPQTMHGVKYLGRKEGRAFLQVSSMSTLNRKKWSERVIYAEWSELEPAFRAALPETEMKGAR